MQTRPHMKEKGFTKQIRKIYCAEPSPDGSETGRVGDPSSHESERAHGKESPMQLSLNRGFDLQERLVLGLSCKPRFQNLPPPLARTRFPVRF